MAIMRFMVAFLVITVGCGSQSAEVLRRFTNSEFKFEISVPEDLSRFGWLIVRPQDSNLTHRYIPPGSSEFVPMAVIVPPGQSFPVLAPFFVDVFPVEASITYATILGDLRSAQEENISRRPLVINGEQAEELMSLDSTNVVFETFLVRNGIGYVINSSGASDVVPSASDFIVDSSAYRDVVNTFRFLE